MSFDLKLINGGISIGPNGDVAIVENGEKLVQDVLKICTTLLGANSRYPWYGSPISQSLIGRAFDKVFLQSVGSNQLKFSIANLQRLQAEQLKQDQMITAQEQIAAIQNVSVQQNNVDPRFFSVDLIVLSKAFRRIPISFSVAP